MPTSSRPSLRALASVVAAFLLLACEGEAPDAGKARPAGASPSSPAPAAPSVPAGRWEGPVTGGYDGNRISFAVEGGAVRDVTFQGHWDCADGIETTTMGPEGSFPVAGGKLAITSVAPPDGGASATRFVMEGSFSAATASGTLRASITGLGCDTRVLRWTAAPAAK